MNFKSIFDFQDKFSTNDKCWEYLKTRRFPDGIYCLHCGVEQVYECADKLYKCSECKKRFSIRKGTIFDSSRIELRKWFLAMYFIDTSSKGISSVQLGKQIGVTQKTAWFMAQRIREAYTNSRSKLADDVEVDETFVGGKEKNKHEYQKTPWSQGGANKTIIAGAIQRNSYGNKKVVKAQVVKNTRVNTLRSFICNNTHPEAFIMSDEYI